MVAILKTVKFISVYENYCVLILKGPINIKTVLVQIIAQSRSGDKPYIYNMSQV